MARPRLDHDDRRAKIARAACDVILEVGLENARLTEIGARAGVTTGAVQHYFRNKEDLLFFAKNHVFDLLLEKSRDVPDETTGVERLYFIVRQHLPSSPDHIKANQLLEAFRGRAVGNPALLLNQHKRDRIFLDMLQNEIERLKGMKLLRADLDVAQAALGLNALLDGLGVIVMASQKAFKSVDFFAIVEDHICGVMGAPRSQASQAAKKKTKG